MMGRKPELLAPAGNFEKLKVALEYGADAVYLSGKNFGLRQLADNFDDNEIRPAVLYAHDRGKRVYVAVNVYSRNNEIEDIKHYLGFLSDCGADAIIVSDPWIVEYVREKNVHLDIHLSTQVNVTNFQTVAFWHKQGVKRINLARELTFEEVSQIAAGTAAEVEIFVHGAMCIGYSGRCLMSAFMAGRSGNSGLCANACRWRYAVMEEKRPGEYFPLQEDGRGTYIFNSKDLCLIGHIPEIVSSGAAALKIEGRMKGINYVAGVVRVYREALDRYFKSPKDYSADDSWLNELEKVSHRGYTTGFFVKDNDLQNYESSFMDGDRHRIVGVVKKSVYLSEINKYRTIILVRNRFVPGCFDVLEKGTKSSQLTLEEIFDTQGRRLHVAHANSEIVCYADKMFDEMTIIRNAQENT